jgi:hypothetical protein
MQLCLQYNIINIKLRYKFRPYLAIFRKQFFNSTLYYQLLKHSNVIHFSYLLVKNIC